MNVKYQPITMGFEQKKFINMQNLESGALRFWPKRGVVFLTDFDMIIYGCLVKFETLFAHGKCHYLLFTDLHIVVSFFNI